MKIAFFSENFYPEMSGISDSILETGKELAKRGHQIIYFAPFYGKKNYEFVGAKTKELRFESRNIKVIRLPSLPFPLMPQSRFIFPFSFKILKAKRLGVDIIHSQSFFGAGIQALFASRIFKIPLIGTNHTAITEYIRHSPIKFKGLDIILLKYISWYYNRCNFVTAPSDSVFEEMKRYGFDEPHRIVSNPIDLQIFKPLKDKEYFSKKYNLSGKTVVYAGRISAEKSLEVIIRAIAIVKKSIPEINLVFIGTGNENYIKNLKRLAKNLDIFDNVKFLGALSHENLAEVLNASQIFAITSTSETQSLTLMQSLACGLPVIGVKARALLEYVGRNFGFLIEPNDFKTLASKIEFLIFKPHLREKMGEEAIKFAQNFSKEKIADIWESLYQTAIKKYNEKDEYGAKN